MQLVILALSQAMLCWALIDHGRHQATLQLKAALLIPYMKIQKSKFKTHKITYVCDALLVTACTSDSPTASPWQSTSYLPV